ncbi:MAG: cysteine hydrolase family protein [Nitrospiraceae bacterium]|nr:cysteine hydrolase family protein [Nitrospiraceae bacterium]
MKRVLLVIDVQKEYFTGKLPVSWPVGSFENILKAMDAAKTQGIPVAVLQHHAVKDDSPVVRFQSPEWELHPEIAVRPRDILIEKTLPGSFTDTNLDAWLKENGIDTVTISGYMTQMCCDTTARQAFHRGYKVEFLSDATGTLAFSNNAGSVTAEELHRAILVTQAQRFSTVMKTSEWISQLKGDMG